MSVPDRVDPNAFDIRYRDDPDPWEFASSAYELGRYDRIVAAVDDRSYRRCFEPACSIGVLTERLAAIADDVVACDSSPTAIGVARERLTGSPNVDLVAASIPEWWPDGSFDLVVLSELGYYWDVAGWSRVVERVAGSLAPSAVVVAVHWLGHSADHILDGYQVHRTLREQFGEPQQSDEVHEPREAVEHAYILDRWTLP